MWEKDDAEFRTRSEEHNPSRKMKEENPEKAEPILKEEKAKVDKKILDEIHKTETLIKDQVTLDNWQIDQGIKTVKRSWKLEDNKRWKNIVNQAWQDLSHGTVWESKSDTTYSRSKLSKIIGSICDNKDFNMKTSEGLVDKGGANI